MKRYIKATSQGRRVRYVKASDDGIQPYEQLTLEEYADYIAGILPEEAAEVFDATEDDIKYIYIPENECAEYVGIEYADGTYRVYDGNGSGEVFRTKDRSKMLKYASIPGDEEDFGRF